MGHESIKLTGIYTYVSKKSLANIKSPPNRIMDDEKPENNGLW